MRTGQRNINPLLWKSGAMYLSQHFAEWLTKYARTPEELTAEMKSFAEMRF